MLRQLFCFIAFGFEGRMWDLIVSGPDHCLSFYSTCKIKVQSKSTRTAPLPSEANVYSKFYLH